MTIAQDNAHAFATRPRDRYTQDVADAITCNCAFVAATRGQPAAERAAACVEVIATVATSAVARAAAREAGQ